MNAFAPLIGEEAAALRDRNYQIPLLTAAMAPLGAGLLPPVLDSLIDVYDISLSRIGLMMAALIAPGIVLIRSWAY